MTQIHTPRRRLSHLVGRFSAQRRSVRVVETSAVLVAVAVGAFWLSLLAAPEATEAGTNGFGVVDPEQITRNSPADLPSFESTYQRHTGVLDTLRPR